nr:MAG TPA: hypothetical protein [Caudoviricetes sp.]
MRCTQYQEQQTCVEVPRNQPNEEMKTKNSNSGGSAS